MKILHLLLLALLVGCTTIAAAKDKSTKDSLQQQQFKNMLSLVESNRFQIQIDRVYPMKGFDVTKFNPEGTICLNDSIAKGKLPFFGRAYSLSYSPGEGGIKFDNFVTERRIKAIEKKKNSLIRYQFNVSGENDIYRFSMDIFPNGTCTISVNSNNRENISYSGKIEKLPTQCD